MSATREKADTASERLTERLRVLDPKKVVLVVAAKDVRDALEELALAHAELVMLKAENGRLESEARQRLLFENKPASAAEVAS